MSCVLDILSLQSLIIRKENLLKQLRLVEDQILKKEHEELLINEKCDVENDEINNQTYEINNQDIKEISTKKIILINNTSNKPIKNIIKIIKKSVEEKITKLPETKNIKVRIIPKK
jgi:hypothetical protein